MTELSEAHKLCSKSELKLVSSSFDPLLEKVTPADLKSKIDGVTTLHRKCGDMIAFLHSDSRIRATQRKLELLQEALQRYEGALKRVESASVVEPVGGQRHKGKIVTPMQLAPMDALPKDGERELRDSRIPAPAGARDEQRDRRGRRSNPARGPGHAGSIPRRQQGRRNSSKNH